MLVPDKAAGQRVRGQSYMEPLHDAHRCTCVIARVDRKRKGGIRGSDRAACTG